MLLFMDDLHRVEVLSCSDSLHFSLTPYEESFRPSGFLGVSPNYKEHFFKLLTPLPLI